MNLATLFEGRIRPGYYFGGIVFIQVVAWLISLVLNAVPDGLLVNLVSIALLIAYLVIMLGLVIRRLHDLNKSGWYALLLLIPLVNLIFALWILFGSGDREANAFGPAPTHKEFFKALLNQA